MLGKKVGVQPAPGCLATRQAKTTWDNILFNQRGESLFWIHQALGSLPLGRSIASRQDRCAPFGDIARQGYSGAKGATGADQKNGSSSAALDLANIDWGGLRFILRIKIPCQHQ